MSHTHINAQQPLAAEVLPKLEVPSVLSKVEELLRRYPVPRSALLEVLWVAQEALGWLPYEAIRWSAEKCQVSPVHALGVSRFYTMYKHAPTGRFFVQICQNISCNIKGAEEVLAHAEKTLGISSHGGASADGLFSLLRVECLGACGNGPVLLVNDEFATDVVDGELAMPKGVGLNPERFDRIVDWCRKRAAQFPVEPARDALGGLFATQGHPGAAGATTSPQKAGYAPAAPALGVAVARTEDGKVKLTWRAAPETSMLHIEVRGGAGEFAALASIPGKDKEWIGEIAAGTEVRIVAQSGDRRAKPSNIAKVEA